MAYKSSSSSTIVFSSRVSWIVKVHVKMRHASWSVVDDKEKHELINRVRADFVLDWTKENHHEDVVNALANKYNTYNYELYKHYLKYASHEEILAGWKGLAEPHVWEWLCERWASGTFKNLMVERLNEKDSEENVDEVATFVFKEVLGTTMHKGWVTQSFLSPPLHCKRTRHLYV
ncbi:uncharacterized protein LOC121234450 [Juglans microcarpa x Juglans regia]|uniref:uncharacterized protein LOC121234450 n=1 Tax=Juglans microcarpa x Juglans regia TaxID=2249226 RepID=UPI001B7F480A|nr:uncharacterized protein LOC121234450 [Juglans microcarpa x Juglans regia]